jgi:hypothetical protein
MKQQDDNTPESCEAVQVAASVTVTVELLRQIVQQHTAHTAAGAVLAQTVTLERLQDGGSAYICDTVRAVGWYLPPVLPLRKKRPRPVGVLLVENS